MEKNSSVIRRQDTWTLIRDAGVLQVKLVVDGLRDVVLVPASIVAAVASLISTRDGVPGPQFYRLLKLGKRSERWIDLFAAHRRMPESVDAGEFEADINIDEILARMETFVVDEYRTGGVTRQAKDGIDRAMAALKRRRRGEP